MTTFNEFNRELEKRVNDPQARYMFALMYEQMLAMTEDLDRCVNLLSSLADTVSNFAQLHEKDQGLIRQLLGRGLDNDASVVSVPNDPETKQ